MQFLCHRCLAKRMVVIPPAVRLRTIRCHKCGEPTRCTFNRRITLREQQSGRALLTTSDGREMEVDLFDISQDGVGFELSIKDMTKLAVGREITLKCQWNQQLLSRGRYIVRSVKEQRVGVERQK
jgi:hypothetical protein